MSLTLPNLPYAQNALEPHISKQTLDFHHGKHHQSYIDKTNNIIDGTEWSSKSLEDIVKAALKSKDQELFNNAAQVWNHSFYWQCLKPGGGGKAEGAIAPKIQAQFGTYAEFARQFKEAGTGQFGSGWVWLVSRDQSLEVVKTSNAETPLTAGQKPLLVADVWEHAYYLDYQNRRGDYLQAFLDHLVNWDFVNSHLD